MLEVVYRSTLQHGRLKCCNQQVVPLGGRGAAVVGARPPARRLKAYDERSRAGNWCGQQSWPFCLQGFFTIPSVSCMWRGAPTLPCCRWF